MAQHIIVEDYNPAWPEMYRQEAMWMKSILKENCVEIHHIGSTAVPGLAAKPIIDIMAAVRELSDVDKKCSLFEEAGYEYLGEFGIRGRRYLRKGGDERTHQVHIFSENDTENLIRHLAFRDYMRSHAEEREQYAALKKELAQKYPYDIDDYCDGKDAFVKKIEKQALAEYGKEKLCGK